MNTKLIFLIGIITVLILGTSAFGSENFSYNWWKVTFKSPVEFSQPVEVGLDAVSLLNPPNADFKTVQIEITLVAVPKNMKEDLGNTDEDVIEYIKAVFLGTTEPPLETMDRSFLENTITGQVLDMAIPHDGLMEFYLVPLSNGDSLSIAFRWNLSIQREEVEKIISMVSSTLKEIPKE